MLISSSNSLFYKEPKLTEIKIEPTAAEVKCFNFKFESVPLCQPEILNFIKISSRYYSTQGFSCMLIKFLSCLEGISYNFQFHARE